MMTFFFMEFHFFKCYVLAFAFIFILSVFDKFYDVFKDECGENINLTYKITNVTQCSESQLAELENYFKENYMVDVKPDSAYAVNITETFSGDKKEVETLKTQTIFQYNGNWYIK